MKIDKTGFAFGNNAHDYWVLGGIAALLLFIIRRRITEGFQFAGIIDDSLHDLGSDIGSWMVPNYEMIWEVRYDKKSKGLTSLTGSKRWPAYDSINFDAAKEHGFGANLGVLEQSTNPDTDWNRSHGGSLEPATWEYRNYLGTTQRRIMGDCRALYCLDLLLSSKGAPEVLNSYGTVVWDLTNGEFGHDYGYAVDIGTSLAGSEDADNVMNFIVEQAKIYGMPIGWISPISTDGKHWPMFQLRDSKKVQVGSTTVNHSSPYHYHLMLPRPNWVIQWIKNRW